MNPAGEKARARAGTDHDPRLAGEHACPSCGQGRMEIFYEHKSVPTNSCILLASPEEAIAYPRGDIRLGFCQECGFVSNVAFDPKLTEYSGRYEETQGFSPTFGSFHHRLAERLIERYGLKGKDIIEIGCGKGEFLSLLCELGGNRGTGFDPGYVEGRAGKEDSRQLRFIKDFYSEKYTSYHGDFVCCKMTLEHIHAAGDFISTVRRSIGDRSDTIVFFQIPETTRILRDCAFEDIYYEHCSYFSPGSLGKLFRRAGFDVLDIATEYDDQYLTIEARPGQGGTREFLPQERDLDMLKRYVDTFPARYQEKTRIWQERMDRFRDTSRKTVLWGSGSKGVSFLTSLDVGKQIEYVVDINPFRQGYYMSGTGQKIVSPEFLKEYRPDVVIVMNAIYREEIRRNLQDLGLNPELIAV